MTGIEALFSQVMNVEGDEGNNMLIEPKLLLLSALKSGLSLDQVGGSSELIRDYVKILLCRRRFVIMWNANNITA